MSFWETSLSSGLGAAFGSLFAGLISLGVFYHQSNKQRQQLLKSTKQCLKHELEYNIIVYSKLINELERTMKLLDSDNRKIVINLDYEYVLGFYSRRAYENGVFADYLTPKEMYDWNKDLSPVIDGKQASVISDIEAWNRSEIEKYVVSSSLYYEYSCLYKAKSFSEKLAGRL